MKRKIVVAGTALLLLGGIVALLVALLKKVCPECCIHCDPTNSQGLGSQPAFEVLIEDSGSGAIVAQNATAAPGQPVRWSKSGSTDAELSVTFDDPTACKETQPIGSGVNQSKICTVAGSAEKSPYKYTIKVGGKTGAGLLYVSPRGMSK